jgi:hypothetical protein
VAMIREVTPNMVVGASRVVAFVGEAVLGTSVAVAFADQDVRDFPTRVYREVRLVQEDASVLKTFSYVFSRSEDEWVTQLFLLKELAQELLDEYSCQAEKAFAQRIRHMIDAELNEGSKAA